MWFDRFLFFITVVISGFALFVVGIFINNKQEYFDLKLGQSIDAQEEISGVLKSSTSTSAAPINPGVLVGGDPYPYPAGVYINWDVDKPINIDYMIDTANLSGIVLNTHWQDVEPKLDEYSFDQILSRLDEASSLNLSVVLTLPTKSNSIPSWLRDLTTQDVTLTLECDKKTFPAPWDVAYRAQKLELIRVLGERLEQDDRIVAIIAPFADIHRADWELDITEGKCGQEEFDNEQAWLAAGYSTERAMKNAQEIINTSAAAFPNHHIHIPIGQAPGVKHALAIELADYVSKQYAGRMLLQLSGFDQNIPAVNDKLIQNAQKDSDLYLFRLLAESQEKIAFDLHELNNFDVGDEDEQFANQNNSAQTINQTLNNVASYAPHFTLISSDLPNIDGVTLEYF